MDEEKEDLKNLSAGRSLKRKNPLLKVLGILVLLIFICLIAIFAINGCPWGTYGVIHGYLFLLIFTLLLIQIVILFIRRKRIDKFDKIFLFVNILLVVFLYFSSYRYCIWG